MPCAPIANSSSFLLRPQTRSTVLAVAHAGLRSIVRGSSTIELDELAGRGCGGHQGDTLRRLKAVPRTLRVDSDRARVERERPGRPVIANDFQGRSAVENVDQLVAGQMAFPVTFPRELGGEEAAIAV